MLYMRSAFNVLLAFRGESSKMKTQTKRTKLVLWSFKCMYIWLYLLILSKLQKSKSKHPHACHSKKALQKLYQFYSYQLLFSCVKIVVFLEACLPLKTLYEKHRLRCMYEKIFWDWYKIHKIVIFARLSRTS